MKVKILRQMTPFSESYWESFDYNGPEDTTVAGMLTYINYNDDIVNDKGESVGRIGWECSCLQGVCGGCAMVINERPALACNTFIRELESDVIEIRPLRKFPTVSDLVVDRSRIFEGLRDSDIYAAADNPRANEDFEHRYLASKCLKCGLCLEVCPNYGSGEVFYGAAFANDCYLVYAADTSRTAEIKKEYDEHFGGYCSKSMSCMDVCPEGIPTLASMAKMNRARK